MIKYLLQGLKLARPYSFRLIVGIICGFLAGVANPLLMVSVRLAVNTIFQTASGDPTGGLLGSNAVPGFLRKLLDFANSLAPSGNQTSQTVIVVIIMLVPLSMILRSGLGYVNVYLMNWVSMRVVMDLRVRMFRHVLTLGSSFFSRTSTGTLMSQLQAADSIQHALGNSWVTIIREPITVISLIAVLLFRHSQLTLLSMCILPFTLLPYALYARRVRKSTRILVQQVSDQGKLVHESLSGYRILKAYNLEKKATDEFEHTSRLMANHQMRIVRAGELPSGLMEILGSIGVAAFFLYIAFWTKPGAMQPGDIMEFTGCIFLLYQPMKALIRLHNQLEQARQISAMVFSLLDTKNDILEPEKPEPLRAAGADVKFDHIKFSYGEKPVLHDFSLTVKAGSLVALVGSSGAGKTTVTNLLLRFHDPQQGKITIGSTDIRDVHTRDLRNQIAVVTQETVLFNDTIFNNVALGRDARRTELRALFRIRKHRDERIAPAVLLYHEPRAALRDPLAVHAHVARDHGHAAAHVLQRLVGALPAAVLIVGKRHDARVKVRDLLVLRLLRPLHKTHRAELRKHRRFAANHHQLERRARMCRRKLTLDRDEIRQVDRRADPAHAQR